MSDPRHNSRIIAIQKLFEQTFPGIDPMDKPTEQKFELDVLSEVDEFSDYNEELVDQLIIGVSQSYKTIDLVIAELAPEWPIDKIAKTDLQILRIAIWEGFIGKITPKKVAIDEAIELAKEFSNEQSRKFINGVLGALIANEEKYQSKLTDEQK